jgi:hypothetical protein
LQALVDHDRAQWRDTESIMRATHSRRTFDFLEAVDQAIASRAAYRVWDAEHRNYVALEKIASQ